MASRRRPSTTSKERFQPSHDDMTLTTRRVDEVGPDIIVGANQDFSYSPPLLVGLHAMPGLNPIEVRKSLSALGICPQDCVRG